MKVKIHVSHQGNLHDDFTMAMGNLHENHSESTIEYDANHVQGKVKVVLARVN